MKTVPKPEPLPLPSWWFRPYAGIPPDYLFQNPAALRQYIAAERLQPAVLTTPAIAAMPAAKAARANVVSQRIIDLGIRGGITAPHLHLDDHIYLLSEKQWAALSATVLENGKSVLAKAKTISFEGALNVSSALKSAALTSDPMPSAKSVR